MRSEQPKRTVGHSHETPIEVHEIVGGIGVSRFRVDASGTAKREPLSEQDRALVRVIAGAWRSDPDWDETLASLEDIRKSSKPSPPLEDV